jgi:hypothetical protein
MGSSDQQTDRRTRKKERRSISVSFLRPSKGAWRRSVCVCVFEGRRVVVCGKGGFLADSKAEKAKKKKKGKKKTAF